MMITTFLMGVCMWAVHPLARFIPETEYETAVNMLRFLQIMAIPAGALQMLFVRHTSASVEAHEDGALAAAFRTVLKYGTLGWILFLIAVAFVQESVCAQWGIHNPAALWVTCAAGLTYFWWAIMTGVVHGRQNFFWYGWASLINGLGRVGAAIVAVVLLGWMAAGIMTAAWIGLLCSTAAVAWQSGDLWKVEATKPRWHLLATDLVPVIVVGMITQALLTADFLFIKNRFPDGSTAAYAAASTLTLALVAFTGPIAQVMFPKIVRAARLSEKSNALTLTLIATAAVAGSGALALSVLAPIAIRFGFSPRFVAIAPLLPWYAWCMVPLTLSNVLLGHLLAIGRYRAIGWLALIAGGYLATLWKTVPFPAVDADMMPLFKQVVLTLGGFNLLMLIATATFCLFAERGRLK
jgi:O-antigen/teichoic acid export membrane protein